MSFGDLFNTIIKEIGLEKIVSFFAKENPDEEEILKSIREESIQRLELWFEKNKTSIAEKLKEFDDPIKAFECILLKKLIGILSQIEIQHSADPINGTLSPYKRLINAFKSELSINEN